MGNCFSRFFGVVGMMEIEASKISDALMRELAEFVRQKDLRGRGTFFSVSPCSRGTYRSWGERRWGLNW